MQQPAIRVALRGIRDFAKPFKSQEEIVWRYFLIPETDFKAKEIKKEPTEIKIDQITEKKELEKPLDIFAKQKAKPKEKKKSGKKSKSPQKEKFFGKIKEFLTEKSMELKDIESFTKNEIILRIAQSGQEKILVAYNKKKIIDSDIIKAHKKAYEKNLPYIILCLNEPTKKISDMIKAIRGMSSIHGLK